MADTLSPTTADAVLSAVREAVAQDSPLEIRGGGTKRDWGAPVRSNRILDLSGLSGVTLYEPGELVLSAKAGTPVDEIAAVLAENRQMLAFEPMDMSGIFLPSPVTNSAGSPGERRFQRATLGGVIACNLSGPRRIKAGAARDHFLGLRAVSGRGEAFKAGGRVMKNVTGYDLPKLLCGSFGTLAVMTDITVKVLPAPEKSRTVLVLGLGDAEARDAMAASLNSSHEVSGAAHLPARTAARSGVGYVRSAGRPVTAIRVEGFGPSVDARCRSLRELLAPFGLVEELHTTNTVALWREIRDVAALLPDRSLDLWRLSLPPASGAAVVASLGERLDAADYFYDWGGGLLWIATPPAAEMVGALHAAIGRSGGHAVIVRGSVASREAAYKGSAASAALAQLAQRLKDAFDPRGILNPGRAPAAG